MSIMPYPPANLIASSDGSNREDEEDFTNNRMRAFELLALGVDKSKKIMQESKKVSILQKIVENILFQIFITLLTVCSLFMEDFRIIFVEKSSDSVIDGLNIAFITIFMIEILMSLSIPGYAWSFFFFLDVLSTLSIILDISILTNLLYSSNGGSTSQLNLIIRNSKASRAAARTVRVMKIFRLARIVKLYKSALKTKELNAKKMLQNKKNQLRAMKMKKIKQALREQEGQGTVSAADDQINRASFLLVNDMIVEDYIGKDCTAPIDSIIEDQIDEQMGDGPVVNTQQSKISKMLSDSTMKKIIIVILFLMFSVPALQMSNYRTESNAWDFLASFVAKALEQPQIQFSKINQIITKTIQSSKNLDTKQTLVVFRTPFSQIYSYDSGELDNLRLTDISLSEALVKVNFVLESRNFTENEEGKYEAVTIILDSRQFNRLDSCFSIIKILFICFVIIYLLNTFNGIIGELIIEPIEKILEQVKNQGKKQSQKPDKTVQQISNSNENNKKSDNPVKVQNNYETAIVHQAISKISSVISKVFGVNGKEIIYQRIFDRGTVVHNYLDGGRKSYCLMGLCSVEGIETIREVLGAEWIILCNQITQYLHTAAYRYGGSAIMNYDNNFLVTFKCPYQYAPSNQPLLECTQKHRNTYLNILTDFSLCAMVKTMVKINKQSKFYKYRKDSKILKYFGQNFQVKLVCTLHAGWITEAFVGSSFKMDLCHFGKALLELKQLARYTNRCGNNIFLSEDCYSLLTDGMKRYLRVVEKYQGHDPQFRCLLYRVDLNLQNISPPKSLPIRQLGHQNKKPSTSVSLKRQLNFEALRNDHEIALYKASVNYTINQLFIASKKQLREVLKNVIGDQFRSKYMMAYDLMLVEDWFECRQILEQLLSFNKEDPLVLKLLNSLPEGNSTMRPFKKKSKYLQL